MEQRAASHRRREAPAVRAAGIAPSCRDGPRLDGRGRPSLHRIVRVQLKFSPLLQFPAA